MRNEWALSLPCARDKRLWWSFASVFALGFLAHAFSYFALYYSHDTLYCLYRMDDLVQIGYGRFLQPVYTMLRGNISIPWVSGLYTLFWLSLSLYVLVCLFDVKQSLTVVLLAAVLVTWPTLSFSNAGYFNFSDIYLFAFFLSVLAVWLMERGWLGFLAGVCCVAVALGQYQCYIAVTCGVLMMLFMQRLALGKTDAKGLWRIAVKGAVMLTLGGLLYKAALDMVLAANQMELSKTYNGIAGLGDYEGYSRLGLLLGAYRYVLDFLRYPATDKPTLVAALYALLVIAGLGALTVAAVRSRLKPSRVCLLLMALALFPLAMNITYFLSRGMIHILMAYPLVLTLAFPLLLLDGSTLTAGWEPAEKRRKGKGADRLCRLSRAAVRVGVPAAVLLIAVNSATYANGLYLKKQLEYQSTMSCMTRVVMEMERTPGYRAGETPTVFIGELSSSKAGRERTGFEKFRNTGSNFTHGITFYETEGLYMEYIMDDPMRSAPLETKLAYELRPEVQSMPAFPDQGYLQMLDGVMVIKFSNP